jgi:hypothetical protein
MRFRPRFTIRDLLWLTLVAGILTAVVLMATREIRYQWRLYMYSYGGITEPPTR